MDGTLCRASYVFIKSCIYCGGWRKVAKMDSYTAQRTQMVGWVGWWKRSGMLKFCCTHNTRAHNNGRKTRDGGREGEEGNDFSPNPSGVEASAAWGPTAIEPHSVLFPKFSNSQSPLDMNRKKQGRCSLVDRKNSSKLYF